MCLGDWWEVSLKLLVGLEEWGRGLGECGIKDWVFLEIFVFFFILRIEEGILCICIFGKRMEIKESV